MITIKKEIEFKYKPGDKIAGSDYWYSSETFKTMMDDWFEHSLCKIVKGRVYREREDVGTLLALCPSDIIGEAISYTIDKLNMYLYLRKINEGLLSLIMTDKLQLSPAIIVCEKDEITKEILKGQIITFELSAPRAQKS